MQTMTQMNRMAEAAARERIAELWCEADVHPCYPASDNTVLELARTGGYAIDAERLEQLFGRGLFGGVAERDGARRWMAADIMALFSLLEVLREFDVSSPLHRPKATAMELQYHEAKAAGREPFPDLAGHPVEILLVYMRETADFNLRVGLWLAIKEKLGV